MTTATPAFPGTNNAAQTATPAPLDDSADTQKTLGLQAPVQSVAQLYSKTTDVAALSTSSNAPAKLFPQGRAPGLYNKTLLGLPFVVVSQWQFRTAPARMGKNAVGEPVSYPAREVCQVYLQLVDTTAADPNEWKLLPAELATLSGAYLCNQLRNLTPNELIGAGVFTLAPNPAFSIPNGHPVMLKYWERGKDDVLSNESTF